MSSQRDGGYSVPSTPQRTLGFQGNHRGYQVDVHSTPNSRLALPVGQKSYGSAKAQLASPRGPTESPRTGSPKPNAQQLGSPRTGRLTLLEDRYQKLVDKVDRQVSPGRQASPGRSVSPTSRQLSGKGANKGKAKGNSRDDGGTHVTTNAGLLMPRLIFPTFWKGEMTKHLVECAVRAGFRGIDTGLQPKHYDDRGVGSALSGLVGKDVKREDLFIQTKINIFHAAERDWSNQDIRRQIGNAVDIALSNLGLPSVDSLLLHGLYKTHDENMQAWRALEAAARAGKAGQLGVSNLKSLEQLKLLYEDAVMKPAVVQGRFFTSTEFEFDMHNWCGERNIWFQSMWSFSKPSKNLDVGRRVMVPVAMQALDETILCYQ